MKLSMIMEFFGLSIMFKLETMNACIGVVKDAMVVKVYPQDLDFINFYNFKILKVNAYELWSSPSNGTFIRYYYRGKLNIQLIVYKRCTNDVALISKHLHIIVKIAKDYIRINLYGIECSIAYQRVFLGCALQYGIDNYKQKDFTVISDNRCVDAAKEIQFFPGKMNRYSSFLDSDFFFNIYL